MRWTMCPSMSRRGETLGLVGESGCGKSTLARCIVRLVEPDQGKLEFDGEDITHRPARSLRPLRREIQLIFQDPFASLNPRQADRPDILGAALALRDASASRGDPPGRDRQASRTCRSRAAIHGPSPARIVGRPAPARRHRPGACASAQGSSSPTSRSRRSTSRSRRQVLNLLMDLQEELGLAYLFISHDLGVIRACLGHRVGVMYLGRIVELAPADQLLPRPLHPLFGSPDRGDPDARSRCASDARGIVLEGDVPARSIRLQGLPFHTRCPYAQALCAGSEPTLSTQAGGRLVACHFPLAKQESTGR
jgi:peptide/nickel transport system ATP-binding protein